VIHHSSHRALACAIALVAFAPVRLAATPPLNADLRGIVTDSASRAPIGAAEIAVSRNGSVVAATQTDAFGHYVVHDLPDGPYAVRIRFIGFTPVARAIVISGARTLTLNVALVEATVRLTTVEVNAASPIAVDTRTGDQTYSQERAHSAPATTTSQIIQQSVAGAVRAPTGDVHIRGQHAEYTYFIDGVPVPGGITGSLNELFDPRIVNTISFRTGGWDAEFGQKNAAIIDVTTRVPVGGFHLQASGFGGNFGAQGQSLSASTNSGRVGLFGSFTRQVTNMRREPLMFDTLTFRPFNFHNDGEDLYGFAKLQINAGPSDLINLSTNWSQTVFQVPFDSTGGAISDDRQRDRNAFVNLGWRHEFGVSDSHQSGGELFTALFFRTGSLRYTPGANTTPQFQFFPDTAFYNLRENRRFNTIGVKSDYTWRASEALEWKTGVLGQFTSGDEAFTTFRSGGGAGPAAISGLSGNDLTAYTQVALHLKERVELRTGLRFDSHTAPFAGTQTQVSPRIRLNFFPNPANTFFVFYGRLFIPTNVEDLRAITSVAQQGVAAAPTIPERDHFYEAGYIHRFPAGIVTKLSAYHKQSRPGIDDNTVPGSAIVTAVNIKRVSITGVEGVFEIHPTGTPLSANLNVALNHAIGEGAITGGFFPSELPEGKFDLDHDQRLSVSGTATLTQPRYFVSASGVYGSGLTNGVDPADCGCSYETGLFAFNKGIKVKPNFVANVAIGSSFTIGGTAVRPEFFVDNVFDSRYLLKGAFFSGASVGRPRSVQLRVNIGI
jgi:hypothetical protein